VAAMCCHVKGLFKFVAMMLLPTKQIEQKDVIK